MKRLVVSGLLIFMPFFLLKRCITQSIIRQFKWQFSLWGSLFFSCLPAMAMASSSSGGTMLSFSPPASDSSVVFLENIFGIVDGVLHGNGSQMIGTLMGVFNAAVLALGSIIIMYTLIVSTMNTAQKGELLGGKWSSMWVPVRTTLGLALLIPKASGYCLMQVFVMWIVVQGVGAADQMWTAALNYLAQGGSIILPQSNPGTNIGADAAQQQGTQEIATGATAILAGEVCMLGVQAILENARESFLSRAQKTTGASGPCANPDKDVQHFCNTPVPDFLSTVDPVAAQRNQLAKAQNASAVTTISVPMPNFGATASDSAYKVLDGHCGTIVWAPYSPTALNNSQEGSLGQQQAALNGSSQFSNSVSSEGVLGLIGGAANAFQNTQSCSLNLSTGELNTAQLSRAAAIQQMYTDLGTLAQIIVNNSPPLNPQKTQGQAATATTPASPVAQDQFGVPYTTAGTACAKNIPTCQMWGADSSSESTPLFNGTEFQGALSDYNAIMLPTLTLQQEAANCFATQQATSFIQTSNAQGWMLAGSYFFNLANLNDLVMQLSTGLVDTTSGLNGSVLFTNKLLTQDFSTQGTCNPGGDKGNLCTWIGGNIGHLETNPYYIQLTSLESLITGSGLATNKPTVPPPANSQTQGSVVAQAGLPASSVYGFIDNSFVMQGAGQAGMAAAPTFVMTVNLNVPFSQLEMQPANFGCMFQLPWYMGGICLGTILADVFFNDLFVTMYNVLLWVIEPILNYVLSMFLTVPLQMLGSIFTKGTSLLNEPNVNPVIALANMGVYYINYAANMWIQLIILSILGYLQMFKFIVPIFVMVLPLTLSWLSTMVGIGFITAYYIPFLPYMIFTFGSIAWFMVVIEAMVAAPIVALGVIHPEGEGAFGKGETALMILLNVFLRPSMMIIGYLAGIALSYVSVWVLNAGYMNVSSFILGTTAPAMGGAGGSIFGWSPTSAVNGSGGTPPPSGATSGGYIGWAGVYGFFFSILVYTSTYLIVVQKAFGLIVQLPDRVLRWIGAPAETTGAEAADWGKEAQSQVSEAGKGTTTAQSQIDKQLAGKFQKGAGELGQATGSDILTHLGGPDAIQMPGGD